MTRRNAVLVGLGILAASCSPPSANHLDVDASIPTPPTMNVRKTVFGNDTMVSVTYEVAFALSLSLGQLASSDTDVTIKSFAIVLAADQSEILPLPFGVNDVLSKHVAIGSTEVINYDLKPPTNGSAQTVTLTTDQYTKLCGAQIQVAGVLFDGAQSRQFSVNSQSFLASCM